MTHAEKEKCIKLAAYWLTSNLPEDDKEFWIDDFLNYLDIHL